MTDSLTERRPSAIDPLELDALTPLDSGSALPLYMQLAERLIAAIQGGPDDSKPRALPSEAELTSHFGISRPTVRQAMAQLVTMGLVTRSRGRGTFVATRRLKHDLSLAFEDEMRVVRRNVGFQLLRRTPVVPPVAIAERLKLAAGTPVDLVERIRLLDGEPFAHEQRMFPPAFGQRVSDAQLQSLAIISLLTELLGAPPAHITNTIRAVPADDTVSAALGVASGTPLLETEHTYFDLSGVPVLHGIVRFRGDSFEFTLTSPIRAES